MMHRCFWGFALTTSRRLFGLPRDLFFARSFSCEITKVEEQRAYLAVADGRSKGRLREKGSEQTPTFELALDAPHEKKRTCFAVTP